jgi:transposase InsO family protein
LVVPEKLKNEIFKHCHDDKVASHLGKDKTIQRIKQYFIWHQMGSDIINYVLTCNICNRYKNAHVNPRHALQAYHAGSPMERLHIDILGPFNQSNDKNCYVLMMIDQFTKSVEIKMAAIPEQSALLTAKKVLVHFIPTFGCPLEIHTDQGRNFESKLFGLLCELLEIAKTRTTPYRPSSNGQVEKYNTMVLAMIRCFIENKNRAWDRDLPLLAMALHSTVNKNIGFTANKLMLGRETTQPIHLLLGLPNTSAQRREHDPWILELAENLKTVHRYARQSLKAAQMRQKRDYDMRMLEHSYNIGDLIFLRDSSTKIGLSKRLKPPWTGPYLVVESRPPLYKIKSTKSEKVVHHDRMKRCNDRHIPLWIKRMRHELFNQDIVSQEYLILETKENDQMDEMLPYTEDFF